jgi:hypothetical protein
MSSWFSDHRRNSECRSTWVEEAGALEAAYQALAADGPLSGPPLNGNTVGSTTQTEFKGLQGWSSQGSP